jgi:endoglucanase
MRFHDGSRWIAGRVVEVLKAATLQTASGRSERPEEVAIRVAEPIAPNTPGMWHLPEPVLRGDMVRARGCDDIAGCAAMMDLLARLSRRKARADVYCLFTRAEEVGFVGAIGAAKARTLPRKSPIIAIETSKTLPHARIGAGPILRVGDKATVFTPSVTAFCDRVAKRLAKRRKTFQYQRKLMDGGTCESTAFISYGYATTGICLALGNYHNMNTDTGKIDSEFVSATDWKLMVDWFEALVLDADGYDARDSAMREALDKRFAAHLPLLDGGASAKRPARRKPRRPGG